MNKTPQDLINPRVKSGYDHVHLASSTLHPRPRPYQAASGGRYGPNDAGWRGPRRATALEAAQDYCDYVNKNRAAQAPRLNSAGHKVKRTGNVDPVIADLRRQIREHEAKNPKGPEGNVYLIGMRVPAWMPDVARRELESLVKIGESYDEAENRPAGLQTGNPFPLYVIAYKLVDDRKAEEARLHNKFIAAKRQPEGIVGEWFTDSPEIRGEFSL